MYVHSGKCLPLRHTWNRSGALYHCLNRGMDLQLAGESWKYIFSRIYICLLYVRVNVLYTFCKSLCELCDSRICSRVWLVTLHTLKPSFRILTFICFILLQLACSLYVVVSESQRVEKPVDQCALQKLEKRFCCKSGSLPEWLTECMFVRNTCNHMRSSCSSRCNLCTMQRVLTACKNRINFSSSGRNRYVAP